ncbi:hypothetical protein [Streptomyces capitiformicae]|uniref:Uncharacterized protein n=1 Tax=Streptomyces capitiformicae TaxID=2014920 RepID=A0A919GNH7_9ACTN|nr:hypothetical protein [Streptomyces capitiformicae]GHH87889.1 hypothetical protein GCM10017771_30920 [Streptomyces capitiformicae]
MTTQTVTHQPLTNPATEATHYGIPVCHIGEDGNMLALGHPGTRRAFAAFNRHARVFCHLANLADDCRADLDGWYDRVEEMWVVFRKPDPERGDDPDFEWYFDVATEATPGAQPVTVLDIC